MENKKYTVYVTEEINKSYTIRANSEAHAEELFKHGITGSVNFRVLSKANITHIEEE
jgi:hypothetical protein